MKTGLCGRRVVGLKGYDLIGMIWDQGASSAGSISSGFLGIRGSTRNRKRDISET